MRMFLKIYSLKSRGESLLKEKSFIQVSGILNLRMVKLK